MSPRMQTVEVTVFKPSGKWYTGRLNTDGPGEGDYYTIEVPFSEHLHRVWDAARAALHAKWGDDWHFAIRTPGHPLDHPHLFVGKKAP
jgi:hypothetical protein